MSNCEDWIGWRTRQTTLLLRRTHSSSMMLPTYEDSQTSSKRCISIGFLVESLESRNRFLSEEELGEKWIEMSTFWDNWVRLNSGTRLETRCWWIETSSFWMSCCEKRECGWLNTMEGCRWSKNRDTGSKSVSSEVTFSGETTDLCEIQREEIRSTTKSGGNSWWIECYHMNILLSSKVDRFLNVLVRMESKRQ